MARETKCVLLWLIIIAESQFVTTAAIVLLRVAKESKNFVE